MHSSLLASTAKPLVVMLMLLSGLGAWAMGLLPIGQGEARTTVVADSLEAFAVEDVAGRRHQFGTGSRWRVTVVVFLSSDCPISRSYLPLLARLGQALETRQARLIAVVVEPTGRDRTDDLDQHLEGLTVVLDAAGGNNQKLRRRLSPTHVPEAFVLGSGGQVLYRGRIDDRFVDVGRRRQHLTSRDLVHAVQRALDGPQDHAVTRTQPVGCLIEPPRPETPSSSIGPGTVDGGWKPVTSSRDDTSPGKSSAWQQPVTGVTLSTSPSVTWSSDIAAVVHTRCTRCHRPGTAAPFVLATFDDVASRAGQIRDVVSRGLMPPWKPRRDFGHFQDPLLLSETEVALLVGWLDSGLPRGDHSRAPDPPAFPGDWPLGPPDLLLEMPESVAIAADGPDRYWYFVIPTRLTSDRMIAAIDFQPGNPRIVHHASFRYDDSGQARALDNADPRPGYQRFGGWGFGSGGTLGGWAVGVQPHRLAPGLGRPIRAGSDFVLQVHYHPSGKIESDRSRIGVYFVPEDLGAADITPVTEIFVGEMNLEIPAGAREWRHEARYVLPVPVTLHSVLPHMHLLGRRCESWAETPEGGRIPLVAIDDWDFNWQAQYHFKQPLHLPAGTQLIHVAWYDNSAANPFNPHAPPRAVAWGEGTEEEMGLLFLDVTTGVDRDRQQLIQHNRGHFARQFDLLMRRRGGQAR